MQEVAKVARPQLTVHGRETTTTTTATTIANVTKIKTIVNEIHRTTNIIHILKKITPEKYTSPLIH